MTFLDASPQALALATENAARNAPELARTKAIEGLCGDAFERLAELDAQGRRFSLICLDPPAFIKRRKDFAQGLAAYRKINALAMQLLTPGGVFVSCSCSHHLPAESLRSCVQPPAASGRPASSMRADRVRTIPCMLPCPRRPISNVSSRICCRKRRIKDASCSTKNAS